jgi:hypothetical protein
MKKQSRILSALLAAAIAIGIPNLAAFADAWHTPSVSTASDGQSVISVNEISEGARDTRREAIKWGTDYAHTESYVCHTIPLTGPCDVTKSGFNFYGNNLLVTCESKTQEDCIESLDFTTQDGKTVTAKHIGNAGGPIFDAMPELGLQKGGQMSLWRAEGVNNSGGVDTYAVAFASRQDWLPQSNRFVTVSFSATIIPYTQLAGSFHAPSERDFQNALGYNQVGGAYDEQCAWSADGLCGVRQDFVGNPTIAVKFRASSDLGGWFRGRLNATQISISPFSKTNFSYVVTGQPASVARFSVIATESNTSDRVKALFPVGSGGTGNELFKGNSGKGAFATDGYSGAPYAIIEDFRNVVKDTAAGVSSLWGFESISENSNERCLSEKGRVLGIVTTNATAYDGVAPKFSKGQLTYKVAGMHYQPDGKTLTEGTYDLVMRSDVARCLYGFTKAPISATISVVGDGGESKVATTTVSEKDGWLKMSAYGFSFSSPTISVKLSQASAATKKTTITCVKGKLTKKVTAVNATCPAGYKKK